MNLSGRLSERRRKGRPRRSQTSDLSKLEDRRWNLVTEASASSARLQMKRDICMFPWGLKVNRVITNGPSIAALLCLPSVLPAMIILLHHDWKPWQLALILSRFSCSQTRDTTQYKTNTKTNTKTCDRQLMLRLMKQFLDRSIYPNYLVSSQSTVHNLRYQRARSIPSSVRFGISTC